MKIGGKVIEKPEPEVLVIPRQTGNIVLKAQAIYDYDEFENYCPRPLPPTVLKKGGEQFQDYDDKKYLEKLHTWAKNKSEWLLHSSLLATSDLEWDNFDLKNPDKWDFMSELKNAGFSELEKMKIVETIHKANGLSEGLIEQATKDFLAGQGNMPQNIISLNSENQNTESGEPVNVSESVPQE